VEEHAGQFSEGYEAYEQLAIYFENERRQPLQALAIVRDALAELHHGKQTGTITSVADRRAKARFEHRLARLEHRTGRPLLDKIPPTESPAGSSHDK
jgi:hypothetical protein